MTDFERVEMPGDGQRLVDFLCADEWPFQGRRRVTVDDVEEIDFSSPDEANTCVGNIAMQRVPTDTGSSHEGIQRQACNSETGQWYDAPIYGVLRADRTAT